MKPPWSLRSRLTMVVIATVGCVLIALAAGLYVVVRRTAWEQHDDALRERALALAAIAEHDDDGYEMALPRETSGPPASYIEVWTQGDKVLARSPARPTVELPKLDGPLGSELANFTLPDGRDGRLVALRFIPRDEARSHPVAPMLLVLAVGTEPIDRTVASVGVWFVTLGLGALAALFVVTRWSLRRGLRPLTELAARIEQIDDRQLAVRMPADGQPAELAVPIRKLNDLLARLEASFARERQFTADVSHELRTPLAGLRTLLEVTLMKDRTAAEYVEATTTALAVTKQLGALIENLLALARIDGDRQLVEPELVPLQRLVDECWAPYAAVADARALRFSNAIPDTAIVETDREKLRIVITNLLANAAEYTESEGWITVSHAPEFVIEVADSGPAIPGDQIDRVFDRLWRGDVARTATGLHCGIGLSLARALCERLALSLTVSSSPERVAFRLDRQPRGPRR